MKIWWENIVEKDSKNCEIVKELSQFAEIIIDKTTYDAFYETSLEDILKDMKIDTLIITGVMTHLCCETTARQAFVRGYKVVFPIDGTLTKNALFHEASIRNLSHGVALVPALKDIELWLSSV